MEHLSVNQVVIAFGSPPEVADKRCADLIVYMYVLLYCCTYSRSEHSAPGTPCLGSARCCARFIISEKHAGFP